MILADTSVWVQHFRRGLPAFAVRLANGEVAVHEVVIGELAVGNLAQRKTTLEEFKELSRVATVNFEDCLDFLESHRLHGVGLGWNDIQLLAAASRASVPLWSLDQRLQTAAQQLKVAHVA